MEIGALAYHLHQYKLYAPPSTPPAADKCWSSVRKCFLDSRTRSKYSFCILVWIQYPFDIRFGTKNGVVTEDGYRSWWSKDRCHQTYTTQYKNGSIVTHQSRTQCKTRIRCMYLVTVNNNFIACTCIGWCYHCWSVRWVVVVVLCIQYVPTHPSTSPYTNYRKYQWINDGEP